jgi:hypothetical protein
MVGVIVGDEFNNRGIGHGWAPPPTSGIGLVMGPAEVASGSIIFAKRLHSIES